MKTKRRKGDSKKLQKIEQAFFAWAESFLLGLGAIKFEDSWSLAGFKLQSPIGELELNFSKYNFGLTTIFSRFRREKAGYVFTHGISNPYSGKWNFHYDRSIESLQTPDMARMNFEWNLTKLMQFQPTAEFWADVVKLETEQTERNRARGWE